MRRKCKIGEFEDGRGRGEYVQIMMGKRSEDCSSFFFFLPFGQAKGKLGIAEIGHSHKCE
jgi:hypothetical protein